METLDDGILASAKDEIGLDPECTDAYDNNILKHLNTIFFELYQRGIGPPEGFIVTDESQCWRDFTCKKEITQNAVRQYVTKKCHLLFDPPTSSSTLESLKEEINEWGFRLDVEEDDS